MGAFNRIRYYLSQSKTIYEFNNVFFAIFQIVSFVFVFCFFLKAAFPKFLNYPFYFSSVITFLLWVYFMIIKRISINLKPFIKFNWGYLTLFILFFWAYAKTPEVFILKEIGKAITVLFVLILLYNTIHSVESFKKISRIFIILVIIITVLLALFCVGTTLFFPDIRVKLSLNRPFSMANDYNVYALYLVLSIMGSLCLLKAIKRFTLILILNLAILVLSVNVVFTTSRRGVFFLVLIYAIIIFIQIISFFYKQSKFSLFSKNTRYFIALSIGLILILIIIVFNFSPQLKHNLVYKNYRDTKIKEQIAYPVSRYLKADFRRTYSFIWFNQYNGYYNYFHFNWLETKFDKLFLSSENYALNGKSNSYDIHSWHNGKIKQASFYNKPAYAALSRGFNDGMVINLNVPRFDTIVIDVKLKILQFGSNLRVMTLSNNHYYNKSITQINVPDSLFNGIFEICYSEAEVPRIYVLGGSEGAPSRFILLDINAYLKKTGGKENPLAFDSTQYLLLSSQFKFDSTEAPNNIIVTKDSSNSVIIDELSVSSQSRRDLALFAYNLWCNNYTLLEKFIGKGFAYLPLFGEKFHKDEKRLEYPHNPIISTFLYSGILGGIIYLYFIIYSIVLYIRYYRVLWKFLGFYFVCLLFFMASGNSHFTAPFFTLLSVIPFFVHYLFTQNTDNINAPVGTSDE